MRQYRIVEEMGSTVGKKEVERLGAVRKVENQQSMGEVDTMYVREFDRGPSAVKESCNILKP